MENEIIANSKVDPHWLPGADRFWYRVGQPDKYEFSLVDCVQGTRQAGLDQDGLVKEVERLTGQKLDFECLDSNAEDQSLAS